MYVYALIFDAIVCIRLCLTSFNQKNNHFFSSFCVRSRLKKLDIILLIRSKLLNGERSYVRLENHWLKKYLYVFLVVFVNNFWSDKKVYQQLLRLPELVAIKIKINSSFSLKKEEEERHRGHRWSILMLARWLLMTPVCDDINQSVRLTLNDSKDIRNVCCTPSSILTQTSFFSLTIS